MVRHLLHNRGESYIKDLINTPLNFLVPADIRKVLASFTVPDIFSVFGGQLYTEAILITESIITLPVAGELFSAAVDNLYQVSGERSCTLQIIHRPTYH